MKIKGIDLHVDALYFGVEDHEEINGHSLSKEEMQPLEALSNDVGACPLS